MALALFSCVVGGCREVEEVRILCDGTGKPIIFGGAGIIEVVGNNHRLISATVANDTHDLGFDLNIAVLGVLVKQYFVELHLNRFCIILCNDDLLRCSPARVFVNNGDDFLTRIVGPDEEIAVLIDIEAEFRLASFRIDHHYHRQWIAVFVIDNFFLGFELTGIERVEVIGQRVAEEVFVGVIDCDFLAYIVEAVVKR